MTTAQALCLSAQPIKEFTNFFTGAGTNRWTNLKLAEAYARLATNTQVHSAFCVPSEKMPPPGAMFENAERHAAMIGILSQQHSASWVRPNAIQIGRWVEKAPCRRVVLSKTGTTTRGGAYANTSVFAMFIGATAASSNHPAEPASSQIDWTCSQPGSGDLEVPTSVGDGLVVVAHIDTGGESLMAVRLVDSVFPLLQTFLPP